MKRRDECRYCGSVAHGYGCSYGPDNIHVEVGDSEHCIYCGSTSYGLGCSFNDSSVEEGKRKPFQHIHGHGDKKCIYCGQEATGFGCPYSPNGKHVL